MINRMIDEQTLNDLQYAGFPELIVTDEVMIEVEKKKFLKIRMEVVYIAFSYYFCVRNCF